MKTKDRQIRITRAHRKKIRLEGLEKPKSKAMEEPMAPETPFVKERPSQIR